MRSPHATGCRTEFGRTCRVVGSERILRRRPARSARRPLFEDPSFVEAPPSPARPFDSPEAHSAEPRDETSVARFLESAQAALFDRFGFRDFRAGQLRVIESIARGRDVLCIMPTGSGKSLCYQVPSLILPGITLVVSPLIALMKDQVDALRVREIPATFINSSLDLDEQQRRIRELRAGAYRLVYVAPERFRSASFRDAIGSVRVSLLAVDEAHCISQWGHDFRPDYRRLREVRQLLAGIPTIALTATATPEIQDDVARQLDMAEPVRVITGFDRPNLAYRVLPVSGDAAKLEALEKIFRELAETDEAVEEQAPSAIIYAGTRRATEQIAGFLCGLRGLRTRSGAPLCQAYHAGLGEEGREQAQNDFMEGRVPWVAATNAFGMGVDKSDIRLVVHYQIPGSVEAYYQEVGRAGRDGLAADCVLLFDERDRYLQEFFIDGAHPSRETIEAVYEFLFTLEENPIFRPVSDLEALFATHGSTRAENGMAFRAAVSILEHAGALERLDHFDHAADVSKTSGRDWLADPYGKTSPVRSSVWRSLRELFAADGRDSIAVSLERWSARLEIGVEALRRAIQHLEEDGWIRFVPPFRGRAIRLPEKRSRADVDFRTLEAKKSRERQRLQRTISFARSTECRRNVLLRYFGEEVPSDTCGRCDACRSGDARDPARPANDAEALIVRKALSGVARCQGRCGRSRIIAMLRGSRTKAVEELRLQELSTFGLLAGHSKRAVQDLLRCLEDAGYIHETSKSWFTLIHLTPLGRKVMRSDERPVLAMPPTLLAEFRGTRGAGSGTSAAEAASATRGASVPMELDSADEELFQRLRRLRRQLAEERGVPPYCVCHDRTLRALAQVRPKSSEALLLVPGIGQRTLALVGEAFLREING
jgi:ATP-dependent DNA helicase RecQ